MRKLRWEQPERDLPKRPYRDTALVYAGFAVVIVIVATATGGSVVRAVAYAVGFWVLATGYGMWRWRAKLREHARKERSER
jgi:uncharacterized membrane protein YidH (DUF202 family)